MTSAAPQNGGQRTLLLGLAGLLPASLVVLLLVNQPTYGEWRLYPSLRLPLAGAALGLAVATLVSWALADRRLGARALMGLAWAGVTVLIAIGPFLEASPRPRLYALDLQTGQVQWATTRSGEAPIVIDGDLYVTDPDDRALIALDPSTGDELWRDRLRPSRPHSRPLPVAATLAAASSTGEVIPLDPLQTRQGSGAPFRGCVATRRGPVLVSDGATAFATTGQRCDDDGAAAAYRDGVVFVTDHAVGQVSALDAATGAAQWRAPVTAARSPVVLEGRLGVVSGTSGPFVVLDASNGERVRELDLAGEDVVAVAGADSTFYLYTASSLAGPGRSGTIVALDATTGQLRWRRTLPAAVVAAGGPPALGAHDRGLVVGGGPRVVDLDASTGEVHWGVDVTTLGKSRRYALPGSLQRVTVADGRVFLSTSTSD